MYVIILLLLTVEDAANVAIMCVQCIGIFYSRFYCLFVVLTPVLCTVGLPIAVVCFLLIYT